MTLKSLLDKVLLNITRCLFFSRNVKTIFVYNLLIEPKNKQKIKLKIATETNDTHASKIGIKIFWIEKFSAKKMNFLRIYKI